MDELDINTYPEYSSILNYYRSNFSFKMKIEEENKFTITLNYDNILEYFSVTNFNGADILHSQFKTLNKFFIFLNKQNKKFIIYISKLNKEYCDIVLKLTNDKYFRHVFKLKNKDVSQDLESIKEQKVLNVKVDDLIILCENSDNYTVLKDVIFQRKENCYVFNFVNHSYIIFISKIQVIIHISGKNENRKINDYIRTNYDIYNLLNKNEIQKEEVFFEEYQLDQVINGIYSYIKNNILEFHAIKKRIPKAIFGQKVLKENNDYKREEYSEFFADYFGNYSKKKIKKNLYLRKIN